jgi:c-di-GMP-binding flagellar brake protein YcgR
MGSKSREEEQRRYPRLDAKVKIIYGVMARMHKPFSSLSTNVSGGGICIPLERRLKKGEILELEMDLPGRRQPLFALGKVAWVKKVPANAKDAKYYPFQAGIEFVAIEQDERESISKYAA